mmetsp:Transcript_24666/g.48382  ORF Transcript_24666/g.48382 Transcript_24666/m.48382 type:complete len:293 (-) Transcript_24666:548-1426(-)
MGQSQKPFACHHEVTSVFKKMESHQIGTEHCLDDLFPDGQIPEDFRGRKGRVKEEPHVRKAALPRDEHGDQHQMIVMDPHNVVVCRPLHDRLCPLSVDRLVRVPFCVGEWLRALIGSEEDIMEEGPEDGLAEEEERLLVGFGGPHRNAPLRFQKLCNLRPLLFRLYPESRVAHELHRNDQVVPYGVKGGHQQRLLLPQRELSGLFVLHHTDRKFVGNNPERIVGRKQISQLFLMSRPLQFESPLLFDHLSGQLSRVASPPGCLSGRLVQGGGGRRGERHSSVSVRRLLLVSR